jgi:RimJ/RimL family protein N-acetyltransferase
MITFERADPHPDSLDSQRIWQWRNDPLTRQMSTTTEEIPWAQHRAWYARAACDEKRVLLIASVEEAPAGMVRFELSSKSDLQLCAEISINLSPAVRGQGRGQPVLAAACAWGFDTLKLDRIFARVKAENLRSIRIFEGTGFVLDGEHGGFRAYHLTSRALDSARAAM